MAYYRIREVISRATSTVQEVRNSSTKYEKNKKTKQSWRRILHGREDSGYHSAERGRLPLEHEDINQSDKTVFNDNEIKTSQDEPTPTHGQTSGTKAYNMEQSTISSTPPSFRGPSEIVYNTARMLVTKENVGSVNDALEPLAASISLEATAVSLVAQEQNADAVCMGSALADATKSYVEDFIVLEDKTEHVYKKQSDIVSARALSSINTNALKAPLRMTQPRTPRRSLIIMKPLVVHKGSQVPHIRQHTWDAPHSVNDQGSPNSGGACHLSQIPVKRDRYRRLEDAHDSLVKMFRFTYGKKTKRRIISPQLTLETALRQQAYRALDDRSSLDRVYRILRRKNNVEDHQTYISGRTEPFQPRNLTEIETRWLERAAYAHVVLGLMKDGELSNDQAAEIITQLLPLRRHLIVTREKFAVFLAGFDMGAGDVKKLLSLQMTRLEFDDLSTQTLVRPPKYIQRFEALPKSGLYPLEPTRGLRGYELLRLVEAACYERDDWEGFHYDDATATFLQYYEAYDALSRGRKLPKELQSFRRNWNSVEQDYLRRGKLICELRERSISGNLQRSIFITIHTALIPVGIQPSIDSWKLSKYLYRMVFDSKATCGLELRESPHILILHEDNRDRIRKGQSEREVLVFLQDEAIARIREEVTRGREHAKLRSIINAVEMKMKAKIIDERESQDETARRLKDYAVLATSSERRLEKREQEFEKKMIDRSEIRKQAVKTQMAAEEELEREVAAAKATAEQRIAANRLLGEQWRKEQRSKKPWWKRTVLDVCDFRMAKLKLLIL